MFLKQKINGGALSYAVFMLIVSVILIGAIITIAYYYFIFHEKASKEQLLPIHAQSLLNAAQYNPDITFPWDGKSLELTEDKNYTFNVEKKNWGLYSILSVEAKYRSLEYNKSILVGGNMPMESTYALYLANFSDGLFVGGNTFINGDCYLPKGEVDKASMGGQIYKRDTLIFGDIEKSKITLPAYDTVLTRNISNILDGLAIIEGEKKSFDQIESAQMEVSFNEESLVLYTDKPLYLQNCSFKGQIAIVSSEPITVMGSCELDLVQLYAPTILFMDNFKGSVQAFARDTLLVHENVSLNYPSAIGVVSNDGAGILEVEGNTNIEADVFMVNLTNPFPKNTLIQIEKDCTIKGLVYSQGKLDLKGDVYGQVLTHELILKSSTSYYESHLLDVEINPEKLSPYFFNSLLFKQYPLNSICDVD